MQTGAAPHAHELLALLRELGEPCSRDRLLGAAERRFGPEVRFRNCSGSDFTIAELLAFLERKGKVAVEEGGFVLVPERLCSPV